MATIFDADVPSAIYSPLDPTRSEVRFIEIMPSTANDQQVSCRLKTMELAEDVRYVALSYVWGDSNITEDIVVNGITLPVTVNLASALKYFRKNGLPDNKEIGKLRYLWADAICINQTDVLEKNNQVRLMGKLYRNASAVLSWLGTPDFRHHDEALQIIHDIAPTIGATPDHPITKPSDELIRAGFEWLISTLGPLVDNNVFQSEKWEPLIVLRDSAYWRRIWILQEMVLAKSQWAHWFVCGDASATFGEVHTFCLFIRSIGESIFPPIGGYEAASLEQVFWKDTADVIFQIPVISTTMALRRCAMYQGAEPIGMIFKLACAIASNCSATLPHDFIYALLGIVSRKNIEINYRKPVKEVYLNATAISLNEMEGFLETSGCGFNVSNEHGLPSWVTDLTKLPEVGFRDPRNEQELSFNIETLPLLRITASDALRIHGALCAHVELIKRIDFHTNLDGTVNDEKTLYRLCVDYLVEFFGPDDALSILTGLEIPRGPGNMAGKLAGRRPLEVLFNVLGWKERDSRSKSQAFYGLSGLNLSLLAWAFLHMLLGCQEFTPEEKKCAEKRLRVSDLGDFMATMFTNCDTLSINMEGINITTALCTSGIKLRLLVMDLKNTTLFKTDTGLLGIGPPGLGPGDLVCVVQGHTLPVLLREVKELDGGSHLEHVGCCYVLGLSDGEPAAMIKSGELKIQEFQIQ